MLAGPSNSSHANLGPGRERMPVGRRSSGMPARGRHNMGRATPSHVAALSRRRGGVKAMSGNGKRWLPAAAPPTPRFLLHPPACTTSPLASAPSCPCCTRWRGPAGAAAPAPVPQGAAGRVGAPQEQGLHAGRGVCHQVGRKFCFVAPIVRRNCFGGSCKGAVGCFCQSTCWQRCLAIRWVGVRSLSHPPTPHPRTPCKNSWAGLASRTVWLEGIHVSTATPRHSLVRLSVLALLAISRVATLSRFLSALFGTL